MDAKDLRIKPALTERSSDGSKYAPGGTALQCNRNKSYQDIGSNQSGKVDAPSARPCAVIGPDRVVPPTEPNDAYLKKAQVEPWPCSESVYHHPPEYTQKAVVYHNPTRNISPRQTFQENMQRIMVPPTYNSAKVNEETGFIQKLTVTSDAKYCDVPYSVNSTTNDTKNMRSEEMCLPNVNSALVRPPHSWAQSGINVRPQRPYVSTEMYQYTEYPSCAGPRPVSISRPHRTITEDSGFLYPEQFYQEPNVRFKPYPNMKERYPQARYDYVTNFSNPFHPPPCPQQKFEVSKSLPPHPHSGYPHFKYIDSRMPESILDGYQRPVGQQGSYNIAYRNSLVHPAYGPVMNNNSQSKIPPYPPDGSFKAVASNKHPYDSNGKIYVEYDNARTKPLPPSEGFYHNEMSRHHVIPKGAMPNFPSINVHPMPPHSYYKKDNPQIKNYDYVNHYKNFNHATNMNSPMQRLMPLFSPNTIAISPNGSNTSNDISQTRSTSQEDFGYVSQSSASIRSIDLGNGRIPNDYYGRYYDPRYGAVIRTAPTLSKSNRNSSSGGMDNKEKKDMDVRKFLQMWNEGDDDNTENNSSKDIQVQNNSHELNNTTKPHGVINNQEQLYVLGSVHVPSEELSKYEHIQKVSKLPENIKGYNSIELLHQFEEVIESSNMSGFKFPTTKEFHVPTKQCAPKQSIAMLPRPISPLDVEAKISQSVIHKEVGCNFEIKPCSPKMLNVEIASPVQNILSERIIEKVTNPLSMINSPILNEIDNIQHSKIADAGQEQRLLKDGEEISSCKMINTQFSNSVTHSAKTGYSIQDLESNAGVCLASLPRLDNDIELNFPEVNQQFINANKVEPASFTHMKDLPGLGELDQTNCIFNNIKPENVNNKLTSKADTEREFTKLSKYRKIKTNIPDEKMDTASLLTIRTNSVIIKNPENTKKIEIDKEQYPISKIKMDQQICNDIASQVNFVADKLPDINVLNDTKSNDIAHISQDVAIDFRLHKEEDKTFEFKYNTTRNCEATQIKEEIFNNSDLYENNDGLKKCSEIKEVSLFTKDINGDFSSAKDDTENNVAENNISLTTNETSFESSYKTEKLKVPEIVNELHVSSDVPYSLNRIIRCKNDIENEILKLPIPIGDLDKTIVPVVENSNKETIPKLQDESTASNHIEMENEIHEIGICNLPYESCKVIKPNEDINVIDIIETQQSDLCKVDIIEEVDESTSVLAATKINEEQNTSSEFQVSMDNSYETFSKQLEQNENWVLHTEHIEFCDSKNNTQITAVSHLDEGFVSIDDKQNCDEESVFNTDVDNVVDYTNINIEKCTAPVEDVSMCFGYGSKELYSPWIQNLIMFNEGFCYVPCYENKSPLVEVNNLITISKSGEAVSDNVNDLSIESSELTVCESRGNNDISDDTSYTKNNLQDESNTFLPPTHYKQSNIQMKIDNEIIDVLDNFSQNIEHDECLEDKEKNAKDETVKEVLLGEIKENMNNKTSETNMVEKNGETFSYQESDIQKQIKDTHDNNIEEKAENKNKIVPNVRTTIQRISLKRSLSDSALNINHSEIQPDREEFSFVWPIKRSKVVENESEIIAQNLCNILQHSRRNSISAVYNEDVSFCILIEDNSILTEESDEAENLCYTELSEDCINEIDNTYACEENNVDITGENAPCIEETDCEYSNITFNDNQDMALDGTWVENVACMETVVSDDIAEDIVISSVSPSKDINFWDDDEYQTYVNSDKEDDAMTTNRKYDDEVDHSGPEILKLYETPRVSDDKTLISMDSQSNEMFTGLYDNDSLEKILSESNSQDNTECVIFSESPKRSITPDDKENMNITSELNTKENCLSGITDINSIRNQDYGSLKTYEETEDVTIHSCESNINNVLTYNRRDDSNNYITSSSPEVTSTTSEEKSSSLLLKITNYKGNKISQMNTFNNNNKISCKFTEKTDYVCSHAKLNSNRPLLTKAAQKYIPPIKESIHDLKVKLSLPHHSLLKLKQIKSSKDKPKLNKQNTVPSRLPKKPKPKFEDVLKSIDEIQIQMHKEKSKKIKKSIPKVVIKKNENGSHYASTSNKNTYNPDLTGRKWQPWVFLEKNNFIDKMAMRRKNKAIFNHRKNAYVLVEKFHKYKSASNAKFVISQPKLSDPSSGQLKYTIRLKHSY